MFNRGIMISRKHLRLVTEQKDLFLKEEPEIQSIDSLLRSIESERTEIVNDKHSYDITNEALKPFFTPVTFNERKEFQASFLDHFQASKYLFNGIYAMEDHSEIGLTKGLGVPHEILIRMRPSEIVSFYIMSYVAKYKDREMYTGLSQLPPQKIILKLANEGLQRYNAIRIMRRKEDKKGKYKPLDQRLANISNEVKDRFYKAFRTRQPIIRDPYRIGPIGSEKAQIYYHEGIDAYISKVIGVFQQIYNLKTAKP